MKVIVHMIAVLCISMVPVECTPELQLVHVIFAHKTYAPIMELINSNDTNLPSILTYEYFDNTPLSMPNTGMLNMYNLGVHLREVYDDFLGDVYTHETMKMRTAGYPLSMIAGQLVNAGLWPPAENQKWSTDINWQPIPTEYMETQKDSLLMGTHCPSFVLEMKKVLGMAEIQEMLSHHSSLFEHVSRYTRMKVQQPSEIALLYAVLETKADLNQSLPHWTQDIFPDGGMYNVSLLEYTLLWKTSLQKQLLGGTIIKEILANSLMYIQSDIPKERKLMMYSGNERNIVGILKGLNLWSPHIPNEGASVIFELYFDNETESHGMKEKTSSNINCFYDLDDFQNFLVKLDYMWNNKLHINYYTGVEGITIPLTIPNCTEICPIKSFLYSVLDLLPQNPERLCNWKEIDLSNNSITLNDNIYNRSISFKMESIIFTVLMAIALMIM